MSIGPIDFLNEDPRDPDVATEFGGVAGPIQPAVDTPLKGDPDASGGHSDENLYNREVTNMMTRAAVVPLNPREQVTGEPDSQEVIDPLSGRKVIDTRNTQSSGPGELGDLVL